MRFSFCLFLLTACAEPPPAPVTAPAARSVAAFPTLCARVTPGAQQGYRVQLKWEAAELGAEEWWVSREDAQGRRATVGRVPASESSVVDASAEAGQHYRYTLHAQGGPARSEIAEASVQTPEDWVVPRGISPARSGKFGRLILEAGAVLRTGEADLELQVAQLRSDNGVIETFGRAEPAAAGQPGRRGGHIRLRVGEFSGDLRVVSRGEQGGRGSTGAKGSKGQPPRAEIPATFVFEGVKVIPGTAGGTGGVGGPGSAGGDAGDLSVDVTDYRGWISALSEGGLGGEGGEGGPGGDGGGDKDLKGATGKTGLPGPSGASGKAGPVCVRIAGKIVEGDCRPEVFSPTLSTEGRAGGTGGSGAH